jgi:hypothetical protein
VRFGHLFGADRAHPEVGDQALLLQLGQGGERLRDGARSRCIHCSDAEVDHVECIEAEVREIVMNGPPQLVSRARLGPVALGIAK